VTARRGARRGGWPAPTSSSWTTATRNPSVKKVLSLVVVDGETRATSGLRRRAGVSAGPDARTAGGGPGAADGVVILAAADLADPDPELAATLGAGDLMSAHLRPAAPPPTGPQLGFAASASPGRSSARSRRRLRARRLRAFADHLAYDEATLHPLAERATLFGAGLVTTRKDWARLPAAWRARVAAWPVRAEFDDTDALDAWLAARGSRPSRRPVAAKRQLAWESARMRGLGQARGAVGGAFQPPGSMIPW